MPRFRCRGTARPAGSTTRKITVQRLAATERRCPPSGVTVLPQHSYGMLRTERRLRLVAPIGPDRRLRSDAAAYDHSRCPRCRYWRTGIHVGVSRCRGRFCSNIQVFHRSPRAVKTVLLNWRRCTRSSLCVSIREPTVCRRLPGLVLVGTCLYMPHYYYRDYNCYQGSGSAAVVVSQS